MKKLIFIFFLSAIVVSQVKAQSNAIDPEVEKRATEFSAALNLNDVPKEARVKAIIATHLNTIRNWHNEHPSSTVPEGINPVTGTKLNELDRSIIADSAMPSSVHQNLMEGLKKELTSEQIEIVLDKYTIGKVAFTMNGYKSIVPDLTADEEAKILGFLKQAREQAVDYKNMKQISAIFEIYKTKSEQLLNNNGRSWRALYSAYTKKIKEEKAAKAKQ
jgi:hypothetical protein